MLHCVILHNVNYLFQQTLSIKSLVNLNLNLQKTGDFMAYRGFQPGATLYAQSFGTRPENVEVPHIDSRAPALTDTRYPLGKTWLDTTLGNYYVLGNFTSTDGVLQANWAFLGATNGDLNSLTTDDLTVVTPTAGTIIFTGNATQGVSTSGSNTPGTTTVTVADWTTSQKGVGVLSTNAQAVTGTGTTQAVTPAALTARLQAPGAIGGTTPGAATFTTLTSVGTASINASGAAVTTIGTGGTGAVNIGNATGNTAVTGSLGATTTLTAGTGITSTLGNITATNGNLVLGTAGNKIVSTSVASTTTAGANSFGTVTLVNGTATISTTAVTASSIIMLSRMSVGTTGANDLGILSVGTIVAATSFVINAWTVTDATTLQADDQSVIGWMIIN